MITLLTAPRSTRQPALTLVRQVTLFGLRNCQDTFALLLHDVVSTLLSISQSSDQEAARAAVALLGSLCIDEYAIPPAEQRVILRASERSCLFLRASVWQDRYRQAVAALEPFPTNDSFSGINKQCKALHASLSLESHLLRFIAKGKVETMGVCAC